MKMRVYLSLAVLVVLAVLQVQGIRYRVRYRKKYAQPLYNIRPFKESVNPLKKSIGDTAPSIIGGVFDETLKFSFMVAIYQDSMYFCGGTFITRQAVLTAAHCVVNVTNFDLYMGSNDWRNETKRITATTDLANYHENYNSTTMQNDIAYIVMYTAVDSTYFLSVPPLLTTVRLPRLFDFTNKVTYSGKQASAVGWGKTSDNGGVSSLLYYVDGLLILTNTKCKTYYGNQVITPNIVCAYGNGTKNICNGDSGGPLVMIESDGLLTQIGITCFGASTTCYSYPSGFTRVTSFLPWLQGNGLVIRS